MSIEVSVIIPFYNEKNNLEKCIKNLICQELEKIEFIFIDDGSNDDGWKVVDKYSRKDMRIKLIRTSNQGVSKARNLGIVNSIGKYIGFVDADDTIDFEMYKRMYEISRENQLQIAMCSARVYDKNGNYVVEKSCVRKNKVLNDLLDSEFMFLAGAVWKGLYKRNFIIENDIKFRENIPFSEDKLFNIEALCKCKKLMYIDKPYYNYIYNQYGAVRSYKENMIEKAILVKKYQDILLDKFKKSEGLKELYNYEFIYILLECIKNEIKNSRISFLEKIRNTKNILNNEEVRIQILELRNITDANIKFKLIYKCIKYKFELPLYFIALFKLRRG